MKKLALIFTAVLLVQTSAYASGVGIIDYERIVKDYPLAQKYKRELDSKAQEMKSYVESQEKAISTLKTPEEIAKTRMDALSEIERRQKDYSSTKEARESELTAKIKVASEAVRREKDLDAVVKADALVAGGTDVTGDILSKLK